MGIWDYNGQVKYQGDEEENLKYMDAFVLVFDLSNRSTFESLTEWLKLAKSDEQNVMYMVVGTKSDLKRQVTSEEIAEFAKAIGASYMEVSAKDQVNIKDPFERIIAGLCVWDLADPAIQIQAEGQDKAMCCNQCRGGECNIF